MQATGCRDGGHRPGGAKRERVALSRLLPGALLQHLDHGVLLDDLGMQVLNSGGTQYKETVRL